MRHLDHLVRSACAAAALFASCSSLSALPPGFVDSKVISGWNQAVGVTFASDGRGFVWERPGRVWLVEGGVKSSAPLIDIAEEVGFWGDHGLLGFALDPNFYSNGYIYLLYVVDYHYAKYYGTGSYDPTKDQYDRATIGRITRYTAKASDGFRSVDYSSRKVLLGESLSTGFPICESSHGVGTLRFGQDGSLLAGCGDGASFTRVDAGPDYGHAREDNIISVKENVGAFRAQMVDSLSGKILRLDPATGDGLPDNPYYDASAPRAARSRVFGMGMRNPFRWTIRPDTAGHGNPAGTIYIGDVGWNQREELDVLDHAGSNFGWPTFEGTEPMTDYMTASPANQDALNPLFGGSCTLRYFLFRNLIVQDTLDVPSWPNPCDASQQIPASIPRHVHVRPVITWGHGGKALVPIYKDGKAETAELGQPGCPVKGQPFDGACSTGGDWYVGAKFPADWRNTYFHADFASNWIQNFVFDDNGNLLEIRPFATAQWVVNIAYNSTEQSLYYINYGADGVASLRKIAYTSDGPPTAVASATPTYGPSPLTVHFSSDGSSDPEGKPLNYFWWFGDGASSILPNPDHTYNTGSSTPTAYYPKLTVTDPGGKSDVANLLVTPNNTPPSVTILTPVDGSRYEVGPMQDFLCTADISDLEQGSAGVACRWQAILHHNEHTHPEAPSYDCAVTFHLPTYGCDGETYFWEFEFTGVDSLGQATTKSTYVYPDCCAADFNGDGKLTINDFIAFQAAWRAQDPRADFNHDGKFNINDFISFQAAFRAGCS